MVRKNNLPSSTIKYLSTVSSQSEVRESGRMLVNLTIKIVSVACHLIFLQACLDHRVVPKFVSNQIRLPADLEVTKALSRKTESLQMEILRTTLLMTKRKKEELNRLCSYEYLRFTRLSYDESITRCILLKIESAALAENNIIHRRHLSKWRSWTGWCLPLNREAYNVKHRPIFFFEFHDNFWFKNVADQSGALNINNLHLSNETNIDIPYDIQNF